MAYGIIKLSHKGRLAFSTAFTVLNIISSIISFLLLVYGLYIIVQIAPTLPSEKAVITLIFLVIAMDGLQLTLYYTVGVKVNRDSFINAHKKKSRYIRRIWNYAGFCMILNVLIIGTMAGSISNHIVRSMHNSMERGMRRYLKKLSWKRVIDNLQFQVGCCGSRGHEDWYNIPWMRSYHVNLENDIIKNNTRVSDEDVYVNSVPWSCCSAGYPGPCMHDPIQQFQMNDSWAEMTDSIHTRGCIEVLRRPIEQGLLLFILASYILFFLQVLSTVVTKLLYTSFRSSIIIGDPFGVAPGWIFGKTDYGYEDRREILGMMTVQVGRDVSPPLALRHSRSGDAAGPARASAERPERPAARNLSGESAGRGRRRTPSSESDDEHRAGGARETSPLLA